MKVTAYKTDKVTSRSHDLFELLDAALPPLSEGSVVAVATKIVSLCEGRVVPIEGTDKDELIRQESQWYLPRGGKYKLAFTITRNFFLPTAGIDESNANDQYILWPEDLQSSANAIRKHLREKHGIQRVGVVMTDSTTRPTHWGTTGISVAYSGFEPLKDYIGQDDVFGRKLEFQKASIANGLAASAVTLMGEGNEQTPLAVIEDVPFVVFRDSDPTPEELDMMRIEPEDDLFWPFLEKAEWKKGGMA